MTRPPEESPLKSRVLIKDGYWLVPEGERPNNWQSYKLAEKPPGQVVTIEQVITETNIRSANVQPIKREIPQGLVELWEAITKDAPAFGADHELLIAMKVMVAGMWSRDTYEIYRWLGDSRVMAGNLVRIVKRLTDSGIWHSDGSVVLGDSETFEGEVEFICNAMVGAGMITGKHSDSGMVYRAIQKQETAA